MSRCHLSAVLESPLPPKMTWTGVPQYDIDALLFLCFAFGLALLLSELALSHSFIAYTTYSALFPPPPTTYLYSIAALLALPPAISNNLEARWHTGRDGDQSPESRHTLTHLTLPCPSAIVD